MLFRNPSSPLPPIHALERRFFESTSEFLPTAPTLTPMPLLILTNTPILYYVTTLLGTLGTLSLPGTNSRQGHARLAH